MGGDRRRREGAIARHGRTGRSTASWTSRRRSYRVSASAATTCATSSSRPATARCCGPLRRAGAAVHASAGLTTGRSLAEGFAGQSSSNPSLTPTRDPGRHGGRNKLRAWPAKDSTRSNSAPATTPRRSSRACSRGGSRRATSTPSRTGTPAENYSIAIPPPNVTGALHMGHALNATMQDVLIRINRMRAAARSGSSAPTTPGIAHPGAGREAARRGGHEPRGARPRGVRAPRVGVAGALRPHDRGAVQAPRRVRATTTTSASRSTRATSRPSRRSSSPSTTRATSTATTTWSTGIPARGRRSRTSRSRTARSRTRSTTSSTRSRTAAASSPSPPCARRRCWPTPRSRCIRDDERYRDLVGKDAILPLVGRRLPVIADEYVKPEFGTGALKITPGPRPERLRDRPPPRARGGHRDRRGRPHDRGRGPLRGADRRRGARGGRRGARAGGPDRQAASPTPTRCRSRIAPGERIEPLISLQWFMRMDELAAPGDRGRARPVASVSTRTGGSSVYLDWLENIRPWCISRQLWWGHRLPVWYCDDCDETYVGTSRRSAAACATASCGARRTCSTPGSARSCGRSRCSAGRTTRPSCAPSTRRTSSPRRATSSTSGSRAW